MLDTETTTTAQEPGSGRRRSRAAISVGVVVVVVAATTGAYALARRNAEPQAQHVAGGMPSASSSSGRPLPPMPIQTSTLRQNLSIDLPGWTAYGHRGGWAADVIKYSQTDECVSTCPAGADRSFILVTPEQFYRPGDHTRIVRTATYENYLAAWTAMQGSGMGTVADRYTTTVDGRRAVVMTVAFSSPAAGLMACETDRSAPADCWNTNAGRTARVAIVDAPRGPVLLYGGMNTDNPDKSAVVAEFDQALATVRFDPA